MSATPNGLLHMQKHLRWAVLVSSSSLSKFKYLFQIKDLFLLEKICYSSKTLNLSSSCNTTEKWGKWQALTNTAANEGRWKLRGVMLYKGLLKSPMSCLVKQDSPRKWFPSPIYTAKNEGGLPLPNNKLLGGKFIFAFTVVWEDGNYLEVMSSKWGDKVRKKKKSTTENVFIVEPFQPLTHL